MICEIVQRRPLHSAVICKKNQLAPATYPMSLLKGSAIDLFSIWGESGFKVKVMDDEFVILDLAWVLLA